jgi:hypothetical protein
MQPVVFSAAWFARHQRPLLTLLNVPVIGGEFRDALGIRRHDLGGDLRHRIVRLLPHAYVVRNPDGTFTMDVRTHAKYAKRLRSQCDLIWRAAHAWDRFVANPLVPAWNLGFDTLTVSPDPNPETTSVDGVVDQFGLDATWATVRGSAGNFADDASATQSVIKFVASATSNQWAEIARSLFLFDTSALTASATITAAVLSLFGAAGTRDDNGNTPNLDIYTATPASNTALANGDFAQIGTVSQTGSPIAYGSWSGSSYNDGTLNGTGRGNVSLTGISKFGARNASYDVANSAPPTWASGTRSEIWANYADQTGSANDPKLVVTYTVPGVVLTGTVAGGITEGDVVAGGKTIILTVTGDTFIA